MKFMDVVEHTMLQSEIDSIDSGSYEIMDRTEKMAQKKNVTRKKLLLGENSFSPKT
jgi:hypothetical protein